MNNDFVIITDSSCDLPANLADELELSVLPLSFVLRGKEYKNYLDEREISLKNVYAALRAGDHISTSCVNANDFSELMEACLQQGKDVLCLSFSSALSNTCFNAGIAAADLRLTYPDRKIAVVDTRCASLGQALLVYLTAMEKRKGKSFDEVRSFAESTKLHICHWFTVDDLMFLRRGGRVSKTSALLGTVLGIKPILHMDDDGRLIFVSKVRGRAASLAALIDKMAALAINPEEQTVFISHGDCLPEAENVAETIRARFHVKDIIINYIGPVIGAHAGPGTISVFFVGSER